MRPLKKEEDKLVGMSIRVPQDDIARLDKIRENMPGIGRSTVARLVLGKALELIEDKEEFADPLQLLAALEREPK